MTALRLSYLPFRAMAETTRFIFRFGGISYQDEVVWGRVFADRRREGEYPFDKVPVLYINGRAVAQSGSIARYAAKVAGCYPAEPALCALNDAVFEMAQELCTINPMINCYTGPEFEQVKRWYFGSLPQHLMNLEAQLEAATRSGGNFYGGSTPSHGDFNVYHHLANARLVEPQCIPDTYQLVQWMELMESLPAMKAYLEERPKLVGIGTDPGLLDKANRLLRQRDPEGRALLVEGRFVFE
ncbi:Hematopoietic prostaglandin D synthase (H-PGDS) (GST class-sigma) (Glutathione S-transferase) (Glutathione-dependent PGD synthase) (Glutathione-requiring prostaglandin D synthase) (Prostaglandin-H2 D-isomerase) [Durusdinium trenchii]|uniref:Glutathione S-transferase n=1 Tax=Durusdinium trenchii TaxID=1381693 RepID=A0ABP0S3M8_9DINO